MNNLIDFSAAAWLAAGTIARGDWINSLLSSNYLPHRYCYRASPGLVWTNVTADVLIALSYLAIVGGLLRIANKLRRVPPLRGYIWIFVAFGLFIGFCAATHLMDVVTVWFPFYPFSAALKAACAAVSLPTAVLFFRATPAIIAGIYRFFGVPGPADQLNREAAAIAERNRAAMALAKAGRDQLQFKDEFLSHVSHELRSPLTAIKQFTSILLGGLAGELNPQQRQFQQIVLKNIGQLQSMIDDLLDVTRLETGKMSVEPINVSAAEAATDAYNTMREIARAKGISLSVDVQPDLPSLLADPTRLDQILIILLDNAIKFTPQGGTVRLAARIMGKDPGLVVFEVTDTGCGMSAETCERIFERLYQSDEVTPLSRKGLGLGLFICRELVTRLGGKIWIRSQPGAGSTFSFTLPFFSLSNVISPLLRNQRWPSDSVALIIVNTSLPEAGPFRVQQEERTQAVRALVQSCLLPNLDVLLPKMSFGAEGERLFVVAFADETGASVLINRIQDQLEHFPDVRQTILSISYVMLKSVRPDDSESMDDIVTGMAETLIKAMKSQIISEAFQ